MDELTTAAIEAAMCEFELLKAIRAQDRMLFLLSKRSQEDAFIAENKKVAK